MEYTCNVLEENNNEMLEKECLSISDVLVRHPRHPSLIHIKKYNVKERRKLFETLKEGSAPEEHSNTKETSTHTIHHSVSNKNISKINNFINNEEDESLRDVNSNYIPSTASKSLKTRQSKISLNASSKNSFFESSSNVIKSPPIPIFKSRFSSNPSCENSKKFSKNEGFGYLTDQPFKSTLISKVVWTGIPETQDKSDGSESGVFLNDCTSDENGNINLKHAPQHVPSNSIDKDKFVEAPDINRSGFHSGRTSTTPSIASIKPTLPPKPPRLLTQLSYSPTKNTFEKPLRCSSSAYEYLSNTHSVDLPQNKFKICHTPDIQKSSTFPLKSPTSSPDEKSRGSAKIPNFLNFESKENYSSTPQDLFLCKVVGVLEKKDKFEKQSLCSETSYGNKSILIQKSAEDPDSGKKHLFKPPKSKKFVSKRIINNPNYECIKVDDVVRGGTKSQSRVTFKEFENDDVASKSRLTHRNDEPSTINLFPLSRKFASVHDEQWRKEILNENFQEPTYADPRVLNKRFVSQTNVAFDDAGYAIPSHEFSLQFVEEEDDEMTDKSIYMRGFSREERSYFKSKVRDAYSILRTSNNPIDDTPTSFMTRSVSARSIPQNSSTAEQLDFLEHEKRLNYVSTIRHLTFKNVSKYEQVKSNLNINLFEYALIVGLKSSFDEDDFEDFSSNSSKTNIMFSWPENLPESDLMTSNFCFPDVSRWEANSQMSGDMFCFFLTTCTGDRKFCWCLRYLSPHSNQPEAVCVVSKIGEAGFYQQLLNGVREARMHSLELAQEALKSANLLKLPKPNKELYINAMDQEGFKYTGVLKRMTESHYSVTRFGTLVSCLPISLLIQIVASVLLERRIILLAEQLSTLSSCIMSLSTLLYPFIWPHTLITVLPPSLLELIHSPTPYILGMFSSYRDILDDSSLDEVLVVDLDEGFFVRSVGDESRILPKKIQKALSLVLSDVPRVRSSGITDVTLTEAFLRMFVEMCGHYKHFIAFNVNTGNIFQGDEFVKAVSSSSIRLFLEWFSKTQMFQVFIHDRMKESFVADLFDQRIAEYNKEMASIGNSANMKIIRSKFFNFFKSYGTKLKKSLKNTFD